MGITCHRRLSVWRALAALPVLLIVDALLGLAYRTNTTADVEIIAPRSGTTHRAIVVFPGYVMPGGTLGKPSHHTWRKTMQWWLSTMLNEE